MIDIDTTSTLDTRKDQLAALVCGEMTLAELEGMTAAEAYSLADFGWMLLEQGRAPLAALVFEALTLGNPRHAYFHALHGSALLRSGDEDGALAAYERALQLDPDESAAIVNRAEILLARSPDETPIEALRMLERAIELDPQGTRLETRRARALAAYVVERGT